jgi:hypothetical protein
MDQNIAAFRSADSSMMPRVQIADRKLFRRNVDESGQCSPMARMRPMVARANIDRTGFRYTECSGNACRAQGCESWLNLSSIDLLGEPRRLIGRFPRSFNAGDPATHKGLPSFDR